MKPGRHKRKNWNFPGYHLLKSGHVAVFSVIISVFSFNVQLSLAEKLPKRNEIAPYLINIPDTLRFTCDGRRAGYYADPEAGCQVYHMCDMVEQQYTYLCPALTLFNQKYMVCDHWYAVDCSIAKQFYKLNEKIGRTRKRDSEMGESNFIDDADGFEKFKKIKFSVYKLSKRKIMTGTPAPKDVRKLKKLFETTTFKTNVNNFSSRETETDNFFDSDIKIKKTATSNKFLKLNKKFQAKNKLKINRKTKLSKNDNIKNTAVTKHHLHNFLPSSGESISRPVSFLQTTKAPRKFTPSSLDINIMNTNKFSTISPRRSGQKIFFGGMKNFRKKFQNINPILKPSKENKSFKIPSKFFELPKIDSEIKFSLNNFIEQTSPFTHTVENIFDNLEKKKVHPFSNVGNFKLVNNNNFNVANPLNRNLIPPNFTTKFNTLVRDLISPKQAHFNIISRPLQGEISQVVQPFTQRNFNRPFAPIKNIIERVLVPPPEAPIVSLGEEQEIKTHLTINHNNLRKHKKVSIPHFTLPTKRKFFIPFRGLQPPTPTENFKQEIKNSLNHSIDPENHFNDFNKLIHPHHMTMTFRNNSMTRMMHLKVNPKCPRCHPAFLKPNQCHPCVIIK